MLTFTTAPKTVLGPCTHALWDGVAIFSRHHRHMPDGEAAWKEKITRILSSESGAASADLIVGAMRQISNLANKMRDRSAHREEYRQKMAALIDVEESLRSGFVMDVDVDDVAAIIPPGDSAVLRKVNAMLCGSVSPEVYDAAGWPETTLGRLKAVIAATRR